MYKILSIAVLFTFFSHRALAEGGMASGGGKGIVCFNNQQDLLTLRENDSVVKDEQIKNIGALQTLDLQVSFMGGTITGTTPSLDLALSDESLKQYLNRLISKLSLLYPEIGKEINLNRETLEESIYWRINPLRPAFDENDVTDHYSEVCGLTTFALQYTIDDKVFIHIDKRLFFHPKHSVSSQAILLLHEFIYSILRKDGLNNSRPVRHIIHELLKK
jgi:hypothetical protein